MNRTARNLDREVIRGMKRAAAAARDVAALIPDMTDCDWDWGLAKELQEIERDLVSLTSRFAERDLYAQGEEGQVEAFYTVLSEMHDELARKDAAAIKDALALCNKRKTVSSVVLRKVAIAMDIPSSEFAEWAPEGQRKNANNVTEIDSLTLIAWINAIYKGEG